MITYLEAALLIVGPAFLIIGVGSAYEAFADWRERRSPMPEFTLSVPVGQRVRRKDGVEFVVETWRVSRDGAPWVRGYDDDGTYRDSLLSDVTIVPETGKLEWSYFDCYWAPAATAKGLAGTWVASENGRLALDGESFPFEGTPFSDPKAVAQEIEDVLARHRREKDA